MIIEDGVVSNPRPDLDINYIPLGKRNGEDLYRAIVREWVAIGENCMGRLSTQVHTLELHRRGHDSRVAGFNWPNFQPRATPWYKFGWDDTLYGDPKPVLITGDLRFRILTSGKDFIEILPDEYETLQGDQLFLSSARFQSFDSPIRGYGN